MKYLSTVFDVRVEFLYDSMDELCGALVWGEPSRTEAETRAAFAEIVEGFDDISRWHQAKVKEVWVRFEEDAICFDASAEKGGRKCLRLML